MQRIVVGAMARSGSTWTFNACRLLANKVYGQDKVNATDPRFYVPCGGTEVEIFKHHDPSLEWGPADKVVTCVRDLRDAFCSGVAAGLMEVAGYNRRGLSDGVMAGAALLFADPSRYWAKQAGMVIRFEQMMLAKECTLGELADFLYPEETFDHEWLHKAATVLELLPKLYSAYEPAQAYLAGSDRHQQNVGIGGYRSMLAHTEIIMLEEEFWDWFQHFNYPMGSDAWWEENLYDTELTNATA
jgi:hypothetical protein